MSWIRSFIPLYDFIIQRVKSESTEANGKASVDSVVSFEPVILQRKRVRVTVNIALKFAYIDHY